MSYLFEIIVIESLLAQEAATTKIQISVDEGDGSKAIHLNLDSERLGFNVHEMQEGEIQSIVDETGRPIMITREADGYKLNVDGKTIDMPLFDGGHPMTWVEDTDIDVDVQASGIIRGLLEEKQGIGGET